MKILQLIQKEQLRGAELFVIQLANRHIKMGHLVPIFSLYKGSGNLPFIESIKPLGTSSNKYLRVYRIMRHLALEINKFKPDILQVNPGDCLKYTIFSKLLFRWKQPVVFRSASLMSRYAVNPLKRYFYRWLLKSVDHIATVSDFTRKDLMVHFGIHSNKITVIPVGIDQKSHFDSMYIDDTSVNIVHVGGFSFEKNHEGLLRIFKRLKDDVPNAQLWLIGDGPLFENIKQEVVEMSLGDSVHFEGGQRNTWSYIRDADVLVLPSIIEGLPAVILEAFYCKTPVVAYDVGGIPELLQNGETGWLVRKNDENGFADALINMLNCDVKSKNRMIENAYQLVLKEYDNCIIAEKFLNTYQDIINEQVVQRKH